jgi:ribA/ribD-fused uncharacterized protein
MVTGYEAQAERRTLNRALQAILRGRAWVALPLFIIGVVMSVIISFSGIYRFLSNFYKSPMEINGRYFATVETFYQVSKCSEPEMQEKIRCADPSTAKKLGRMALLRPGWEDIKISIMLLGVTSKFEQNQNLLKLLHGTKNKYLIEGNDWCDNYWGACWCDTCKAKEHKNMLGRILMKVRREL